MAVLLPHALFWFSSLLLRIENPYTQWVWIANPDQRHGTEHPRGRESRPTARSRTSAGSEPKARHGTSDRSETSAGSGCAYI